MSAVTPGERVVSGNCVADYGVMPSISEFGSRHGDNFMQLADQSPTVPLSYDVVWLFVGILWLLIPAGVGFTERRRGASWADALLWSMVVFLAPVLGLAIWAIYRTVVARRSGPPTSR